MTGKMSAHTERMRHKRRTLQTKYISQFFYKSRKRTAKPPKRRIASFAVAVERLHFQNRNKYDAFTKNCRPSLM